MTLTTNTTGPKPMPTTLADSIEPTAAPSPASSRPLARIDQGPEYGSEQSQAQLQMSQLEQARAAWLVEKQAAELILDQRRQDLDRQGKALVSRLQELYLREKRLADSRNVPEKKGADAMVEVHRQLLEEKERRLEEQERDLLIRETDLRELREVMEREYAIKRGIMNQERLQLSRLREMLRIEQDRFRAEIAKQTSLGDSGPRAAKPVS